MHFTRAASKPSRAPMRVLPVVAIVALCTAMPARAELWSHWTEVKGSGAMVHRAVPVDGAAVGLELHTGASVQLKQGPRDAVEIEADDNVAPLIDVHRDGDTLVIEDRQHFSSQRAKVTVTVSRLSALSAHGSSDVVATGLIAPALTIRLSGSSDVKLTGLTAERVDLHTGGSSSVRLQGICNDLSLHLGGSTTIQAGRLEARRVTLQAGGSTEVTVWAKNALDGTVGGSSDVRYYGVAAAHIATGGSSSVQRLGDAP